MDNKLAVVQVQEDQLSLAIGRKGQNVRLASKLAAIEIEIKAAPSATTPEATSEPSSETAE